MKLRKVVEKFRFQCDILISEGRAKFVSQAFKKIRGQDRNWAFSSPQRRPDQYNINN